MNTDNDALIRAARQLPQEIQPPRDLWPAIAAGIDDVSLGRTRRAAPMPWYYAMAAAVGCMALGGLITLAILRGGPDVASNTRTAVVAANDQARNAPTVTHATFGNYAALGPEYERARAQLAIGLSERIDRLPQLERQKIERNLAEIQRALREINASLQLDPGNTLLQELLLSTYQQELAMLANVNQMAGALPARTDT